MTSLRLGATRCDSVRLGDIGDGADRWHIGDGATRCGSVRYLAILVKLLLGVYGRACPARAPEIKGW